MQNGARYQAILEILTEVFDDKMPADKIINDYVRKRKYIGSKDRRFIVDEVWRIIRNRMKLAFDAKSEEARKILLYANKDKLSEMFDGSAYGLAPLNEDEKTWLKEENEEPYPDYVEAECPKWLFEKIKDISFCKALNEPATTDIRAHGISREELARRLKGEGISVREGVYAPKCLKIDERLVLNNCMAWQDGLMEVQDEASQVAAILADVNAQQKIMDYCCGAGGKALAMSDVMQNEGKILAHDVDAKRLDAIKPRMERLKVKNIELVDFVADSDKDFDRFVLDAPCSGSGTWRRAPDNKFRLTEEKLFGLTKIQEELLDVAAAKTKVGGRIVYITCSVLEEENEAQIAKFLERHSEFETIDLQMLWEDKITAPYPCKSVKWLKMSPVATGTDGFFVCVMKRKY